MARQPIFDAGLNVYAYELLFRAGEENFFPQVEGDSASNAVISESLTTWGIGTLTGGKRAFLNFTRNALLEGHAELVPKEVAVIEILEDVEPDGAVLAECRRLKGLGYTLALDDFAYRPAYDPLLEIIDIVKVDFAVPNSPQQQRVLETLLKRKVKLLAEKVETQEAVDQAKASGYSYFQGYFFSRPQMVSAQKIPEAQVSRLGLMREVGQPEVNYQKIEEILKRDISLSYRLLKYMNSAFFGLRNESHSIRQALALLGEKNVRKWVRLVTLTGMAEGKPSELILSSVFRGRFCETLAPVLRMKRREEDLVLLGMFSLIDAIMDQPMETLLTEIPLGDDIKAALRGEEGILGTILAFVSGYERGDWDVVDACREILNLQAADVPDMYMKSLEWANQFV